MTPVYLTMEAFGPYLEQQQINFDPFLQAGLVLIRGETGAGKTVLLDAMTYALYGRSSGGQRGEFAAMRSLGAPETAETRVEYTFLLRGKQYRFTRALTIRRKRTGALETTVTAGAFSKDATGGWRMLLENPKPREVEQKARELIGLDGAQFCQVMILPQGKFEQLLTCPSAEKEPVLASLFAADRWQRAAETLGAQANEQKQRLEVERAAIGAVLSGFGCENDEQLAALLEETQTQLAAADTARKTAGEQLQKMRERFERAQRHAELRAVKEQRGREAAQAAQAAAAALRGEAAAALAFEALAQESKAREAQRAEQIRLASLEGLCREAQAAREALSLAERELAQAQAKAETHKRMSAEARTALEVGQAAFLADAAAALAAGLREGEACPVCGSADHPAARHSERAKTAGEPTIDQFKALQEQAAQAMAIEQKFAQKLAQAVQKQAAVKARLETLCEQFGGEAPDAVALQKRLQALVRELEHYDIACAAAAKKRAEAARLSGEAQADQKRTVAELQAAQEALTALGTVDPPQPEEMMSAEAIRTLEREKSGLDSAFGGLSQQVLRQQEAMKRLNGRREKLTVDALRQEKLWAFAKLLRGDSGVSLRRYLLGVMLSSIVAQANELLRHVHGGRYRLYRTIERSGSNRKAGLELEVLDAYTGGMRGVESLSGGEKFLVSLALALGLSAVAQAQAGGVQMDAMFIDEGFGSLDPGSITDALEVLGAVRGARRLVGIISHVEALQETIETSIEVVKDRRGSRLQLHI